MGSAFVGGDAAGGAGGVEDAGHALAGEDLQRLRIDRQLEEAIAAGGDPLQVAEMFGLSEDAAVRDATNTVALLRTPDQAKAADSCTSTM